MYVFYFKKKHAKLKGIEWDSDTDSDCEWNILAVFLWDFCRWTTLLTLLQLNSINNSNGPVSTGALLTKQYYTNYRQRLTMLMFFIVCFFMYFITL